MKFKLDENFGNRTQELFIQYGHDVETVSNQNLKGCSDKELFNICCSEQRCLITLDKDFSDIIRFPLQNSSGLVKIRLPINPSLSLLKKMIISFLEELKNIPVENQLLIVEPGRIRIRESDDDDF